MALPKELVEDTHFAMDKVMHSTSLDDQSKKQLHRLLKDSTEATNGISTEEKIQKVTESILRMVLSQVTFLDAIDKKIETANKKQCQDCKAMKLANEVEERKKQEDIINAYKEAHGIKDSADAPDPSTMTLYGVVKTVLAKPWAWIFGAVLVFSPYGAQIVKSILDFYSK